MTFIAIRKDTPLMRGEFIAYEYEQRYIKKRNKQKRVWPQERKLFHMLKLAQRGVDHFYIFL